MKMKKKQTLLLLAAVLVGVALIVQYGCRSDPAAEQFIDIGAVLPLTGPSADIGKWQQKGLDLALKDINERQGAAGGQRLRLVYQDSAGDPKTGLSAFSQILSQSRSPVVFSSISSVSSAILPVAQQQQVNVLMLAVSLPNITSQSEYAYRFNVGSEDEARVMARHLADSLKLDKIAVYYVNDEFGLGALEVFKNEFGKSNGKIVWEESYAKDAAEHRNALAKMGQSNPQGVYVIGYTRASALAIKQLREAGSQLPVFANMALTVPTFATLVGGAMEGATFTTNSFDVSQTDASVRPFVEAYQKAYNEPPNFFGAFAYDALHVVAQSIKSPATAAADVRQGLAPAREFSGVMGQFSVDAARNFRFPVRLVKFSNGQLQGLPQ